MNIGNIELSAPLALAPMAGITDLPFRLICRRLGCGMTVSEMVSAKGLLYKNVKTTEMLRIDDGERPTAIQLFGSVPAELAEAARMVEASGADMIDFNMGCPVPKIVNNGEGSALMKNPQLAHDILGDGEGRQDSGDGKVPCGLGRCQPQCGGGCACRGGSRRERCCRTRAYTPAVL